MRIVIDSDSIRITKGAKDVTHLYSILPVTNAALTINRKNLTVKTDSLTETYVSIPKVSCVTEEMTGF